MTTTFKQGFDLLTKAEEFIKADASVICVARGTKQEQQHFDNLKLMALAKLEATIEKYREMAEHYHVAMYDGNKLLDTCGHCGLDLRDEIHSTIANATPQPQE